MNGTSNYSMHDELAEMRGLDITIDHEQVTQDCYIKQGEQKALHDYTNDHSHMIRGADGSIHTEMRPDSMVEVGGVVCTYQAALNAGFTDQQMGLSDGATAGNDVSQDAIHSAEMDDVLASQNQLAVNLVGDAVFTAALFGEGKAIDMMTQAAGCERRDTVHMLSATLDHFKGQAALIAEDRLGGEVDTNHLNQYVYSTAVSEYERKAILEELRVGSSNTLNTVVHRYADTYYQ